MKKLFALSVFIINFSCLRDNIIVNPDSIETSKNRGAFIKEYEGDKSIIIIDNSKYLIKEVYLTYKIDSKKVHKQVVSLIFKTINLKNNQIDCPDYTKFEILINKAKFKLGNNSNNLVCDYPSIPIDTSNFILLYYDNKVKNIINFKKK